jgi:hypothetical protein
MSYLAMAVSCGASPLSRRQLSTGSAWSLPGVSQREHDPVHAEIADGI